MKRHANPRMENRVAEPVAVMGSRRRSLMRARWAPSRVDQRGSALILTIVCLVMMVLMGTAYIQIARIDRRATRQLTVIDNMGTVRDAIIEYLKQVVREDLIKTDTGGFFNVAEGIEDYDYPGTYGTNPPPAVGSVRDLSGLPPYTPVPPAPFVGYEVVRKVPEGAIPSGNTLGFAAGGKLDDTWLASTVIELETATANAGGDPHVGFPAWAHISNLNGVFLQLPSTVSGNAFPKERVTGAINTDCHDGMGYAGPNACLFVTGTNNVGDLHYTPAGYEKNGFDADGDGIDDSRWTWVPENVRQIGTNAYVVAYRVIDLGSMVNVNVATAQSSAYTTVATDTRGFSPADTTIGRIVQLTRRVNGTYFTEVSAMQQYRGLANFMPLPTGNAIWTGSGNFGFSTSPSLISGQTRGGAWFDNYIGSSLYGYATSGQAPYPTIRFSIDDEVELRAKGGLNTANTTAIETAMPYFLRSSGTAETAFNNIVGNTEFSPPPPTNPPTASYVFTYMNGGPSHHSLASHQVTGAARTYPAMRHLVTTMNGASCLAPRLPGMDMSVGVDTTANATRRLQVDLVHRHINSSAQRVGMFYDRIREVFKVGTPKYLGLTSDTEIDQIAGEYALAIHDYSDSNNTPWNYTVNGQTYYGLEMFPFLREVYVQGRYQASDTLDAMGNPGTDGQFDKWVYEPNTAAIAIEVGNPFDKLINFNQLAGQNAKIRIRVSYGGNPGTTVFTKDLWDGSVTVPALSFRDSSEMKEQHVYYSNTTNVVQLESAKGGNLMTDLTVASRYSGINATQLINIGTNLMNPLATAQDIMVEMQVDVSVSGAEVFKTYDRFTVANFKLPANFNGASGPVVNPAPRAHEQMTIRRDGQKHRYISNKNKTLQTRSNNTGNLTTSATAFMTSGGAATNIASFGFDNKLVSGDVSLDKICLAHNNHRIFNVAELAYIPMFGFYDANDGDFPARISGPDGNATGATLATASKTRWFLSLFSYDFVNAVGAPGYEVVHQAGNAAHYDKMVVPDSTKVPHMSMLLDQFTVFSPRWDGVDNDNDDGDNNLVTGADNDEEQFVPGLMNVNTVPMWLFVQTSPYPGVDTDNSANEMEFYLSRITMYRDRNGGPTSADTNNYVNPPAPHPAATLTRKRAHLLDGQPNIYKKMRGVRLEDSERDKGIRFLGETLLIRFGDNFSDTLQFGRDNATINGGTSPAFTNRDARRVYPNRDIPSGQMWVQNEEYVNTERMAKYYFLTPHVSTRSDRYCAYFAIREYGAGAFNSAPSDSQRFFVMLDRSKVVNQDSKVIALPAKGQRN